MNTERIVVGLDIGTTKVVAVVGKYNEYGAIDILGVGSAKSEGVERGTIVYIDKTVEAIRQAISEAEKHSNVDIKVVTVGIAGEHIRSTRQTGIITLANSQAEISQQDVDRLTRDMYGVPVPPGNRIIHVIPLEYAVDDYRNLPDPVGISGIRLEGNFLIVTASETAVRNLQRVAERAGLEIESIVLEPLASSYACLQEDERAEGVALVDIGGGTTDVAIWYRDRLRHTATIPFGGNVVTRDLQQGCQLLNKQAETLKVSFGSALATELVDEEIISISGLQNRPPREISRRTLARIIQARMEEIGEIVALEIRQSGIEKNLVGGIVLTGGGSNLVHARELFEFVTGHTTRIGLPTERLSKGLVEEVANPKYATATGLVAFALDQATEEENVVQRRKSTLMGLGGGKSSGPRASGETLVDKLAGWFRTTIDNSPVE